MSARRSNRVAEYSAIVASYVGGGAAAFAPASPTGRPIVDAVLLGLSVALVVYAGASAPWWATVVAAGVAMAIAVDVILIALAAIALGIGVWVGLRRRNMPEWRAVSVAISMNVLAWAELEGFFGLTSAVAIAVGVFVFVLGVRRRPARIRRRAWITVGLTTLFGALAVIGFGVGAAGARSHVESAQQRIESGISLINQGEFAAAADQFDAASTSLRLVEDRLGGPLALGATLVPVVSQHRDLAVDLSETGEALTARVASALREVDMDSLRLDGGTIDIAAIDALNGPFADIDAAIDELSKVVASSDSPWLLPEFRDRLESLDIDIAESAPRIENLRIAAQLAPGLLGADGPRVYLVLFTTPSEARGLGGFPGNYAELTIDNGRIDMTDFGRITDLELRAQQIGATVTGPSAFLSRYGSNIVNGDSGVVRVAPLRNLTMTPNFPWVGEVAAELYPQITGRPIDGVIVMDPFVIQALLAYTGPIQLTEVPFTLSSDNAAEFLLRGQYSIAQDRTERIDALDEAGRSTFDALLAGALPNPVRLADDLGSLAQQRRLLVWTTNNEEQNLLRRVGLLGEIPPLGGADGWSFTVTNAGANKIDAYLERRASYASSTDPATGVTVSTLRVELTNTAPAAGLPGVVIDNIVGLPPGTSRLLVSFYSALPLNVGNRDGAPTTLSADLEQGWNVYSQFVDIPPGATVTYDINFFGDLDHPERVVTWTQPLALPLQPL